MKKFFLGLFVLTVLIPTLTLAANGLDPNDPLDQADQGAIYGNTPASSGGCKDSITNITDLFDFAICFLSRSVIPFIIGLSLVLFLFGVFKTISAGDNEEKREEGRHFMLFGIIALFVMISVWGLVQILHNTFFKGKPFVLPSLPQKSSNVFGN